MTQTTTQRTQPRARLRWHGLATRAAATALVVSTTLAGLAPALPAYADFADGRGGRDIIIGKDNDNNGNALIQLPGTAADQSLNNTDVQLGGNGNDVSIWAPGDGSDFFHGGNGSRDAQVVGNIDRDPNGPLGNRTVKLTPGPGYGSGLPSVDVSGLNAQCTIDKVPADSGLGYDFLVRFRNAAGGLVVTLRQVEVEQVFCPSTNGTAATGIVYADLRDDNPSFRPVSQDEVRHLNPLVGRIIR